MSLAGWIVSTALIFGYTAVMLVVGWVIAQLQVPAKKEEAYKRGLMAADDGWKDAISKDAIKTTAVDLQMEFDYADGKQTPRGFVARNSIEARVDDLARLGDVLDAVVNSGATSIHGLRFDVKQREQLRASALQSAVKDALAKAQAISQAAGRAMGAVIRIEEVPADAPPVPMMRQLALAAQAEASTPIATGTIAIAGDPGRRLIALRAWLKSGMVAFPRDRQRRRRVVNRQSRTRPVNKRKRNNYLINGCPANGRSKMPIPLCQGT